MNPVDFDMKLTVSYAWYYFITVRMTYILQKVHVAVIAAWWCRREHFQTRSFDPPDLPLGAHFYAFMKGLQPSHFRPKAKNASSRNLCSKTFGHYMKLC